MTDLPAVPDDLACAICGERIDRGYVPAAPDPRPSHAVCETCGWRDVGHAGCAPEARDFDVDPPVELLRVEREDGLRAVRATDRRD